MRKRGWPPNLYESRGYYSWRDPTTGKTYGLGRDLRSAIDQVVEANLHVGGQLKATRLLDRLTGSDDRTFGAWLVEYEARLLERELAEQTIRMYRSLSRRAEALIGADKAVVRITTLDIAEAIAAVKEEGKRRMAQALRSFLKDCFRGAQAAGWIDYNPVLVTDDVKVTVQRARLTWGVFKALYESATLPWLQDLLALALVSAQRRDDLAMARFADYRADSDGQPGWWVRQRKTGRQLILPGVLRLDCLGLSLDEVVRRCRASGVLSRHLIHHRSNFGDAKAGAGVHKDTASRAFSRELDRLGLSWGDKTPPTLHEVRSLSERLYAEQGGIDTQELLGHTDPKSTRIYHDSRGAEWSRLKLGIG